MYIQLLNIQFMGSTADYMELVKGKQSKAVQQLLFTAHQLDKLREQLLKPLNLSVEQYTILSILKYHHPEAMSLSAIQRRLINRTSNTTRLVEKLRVKGWVKSTANKSDRRQLDISITKKGRTVLAEADVYMDDLEYKLKNALPGKDAKQLTATLSTLQELFYLELENL